MSASALTPKRHGVHVLRALRRNHGTLIAIGTFLVVLVVLNLKLAHGFGYYDLSSTASGSTPLALAAMGATIVIIAGGLDLSSGATISLTNCLIAANVGTTVGSMVFWSVVGVLAGVAVGLFNGFLVVIMRLQPVIVTLATMFIVEGLTLLILEQPGGSMPPGYSNAFTGDLIPDLLPMPLVILALALGLWVALRATPFGASLYASGSDPAAARSKGVRVGRAQFASYVLAGLSYSAAGVFLTAETGSGDPTVGPPMLLPIFVAVVLGGTSFVGGRGGCVGTIFGALTLMLIVNLLLAFDVPTYFSTVVEGGLLILAVSSGLLGGAAPIWSQVAWLRLKMSARRAPTRAARPAGAKYLSVTALRADDSLPASPIGRWLAIHSQTLRFVLPVYAALFVALVVTAAIFGSRISPWTYMNSLLVLSSFFAVLALGQGAVVMSGGLDLSTPAVITFAGILLTSFADGSNARASWGVPAVVLFGALAGLINGVGIVAIGIFPLIMTLAMNGIVAGIALVYSNGTPHGAAPPAVSWLMTGHLAGLTPVVFALAAFVVLATLLLSRTAYGRELKAVGNSRAVAFFAGVSVGSVLIWTYVLSGVCSALVGIMLVGFSGQAFNDMGEPYLLPAIAVVVFGGTLMTGGRGHYLGMFGGALLLTALTTILTGLLLPVAVKSILFGVVIVIAVVGLREKTAA